MHDPPLCVWINSWPFSLLCAANKIHVFSLPLARSTIALPDAAIGIKGLPRDYD